MIGDAITLGIGTPSSVPVFLLVGLTPTGPVVITPLNFCDTATLSLVPLRATTSLVPVRRTRTYCP